MQQLPTARRGQIVTAHLPWTDDLVLSLHGANFRTLLIIRDLRDVAVSFVHYVAHRDASHRLSAYFRSRRSDAERLMATVDERDLID